MDEVRANIPEFTVSQLSAELRRTLEDAFGYVRVRGELGNVTYHSSGHIYLDLKDDRACIVGIIWRRTAARLRFRLEAGLEVVVTGRVTTYPGQSRYQLIIDTVAPAGFGALMAIVEERKRRLAAEGLFDEARKKPLPFLPHTIGVITSPTGAVIRDILHRLTDRFPRRVVVWPVRVQGEGAAEQVAAAIRGFNALGIGQSVPRPDLIIVARGGGSLEDLWSFNEEIVVRAAAASTIPLIAAVGHETDVTLIDFAADKRAPTPTAAAEMAVPVRSELTAAVAELGRRQIAGWRRAVEMRRRELRAATRALPSAELLLQVPRQRLDLAGERLPRALRANAHVHHARFIRTSGRFGPALLRAQAVRSQERVASLTARAQRALRVVLTRKSDRFAVASRHLAVALHTYRVRQIDRIRRDQDAVRGLLERARRAVIAALQRRRTTLGGLSQLLDALSYQGVLARGFALVRSETGRPLRSAAAVRPRQRLNIEFADGRVGATADGAQPVRPRPRRPEQGDLFGDG
jgi:exodeoxyribonuclease VII large subunit